MVSSVFAEENALQGASAFNAINAEHIKNLDSWNEKKEVCLGVAEHQSGMIVKESSDFSRHEEINYLANISFDNPSEFENSPELIAEREPLKLNQTKVEVNYLPKQK